jgi:hypothetical protein
MPCSEAPEKRSSVAPSTDPPLYYNAKADFARSVNPILKSYPRSYTYTLVDRVSVSIVSAYPVVIISRADMTSFPQNAIAICD